MSWKNAVKGEIPMQRYNKKMKRWNKCIFIFKQTAFFLFYKVKLLKNNIVNGQNMLSKAVLKNISKQREVNAENATRLPWLQKLARLDRQSCFREIEIYIP